jgi:hypothetical protein
MDRMKPNMTADEGREAARLLILHKVRDDERREACLDELTAAKPMPLRNG